MAEVEMKEMGPPRPRAVSELDPIRYEDVDPLQQHLYVIIYGAKDEEPIAFRCGPKITVSFLNSVFGFGGQRGFFETCGQLNRVGRLDGVKSTKDRPLRPKIYRIMDEDRRASSYWRFVF